MIKQKYEDNKKNLQGQLDILKKNYDAEKDLLDDNVKLREDAYKQRKKELEDEAKAQKKIYDDQKQALDDQLDAYQKIAKQKLDALQKQESEHDYQNELSEKEKAVADVKADIDTIGNDDSESGLAKKRELQELLAERQKELDEYQHDHSIELQEDAINNELSIFEEQINNKLDILDREYQREQENHDAELERIDAENERQQANHDLEMERLEADYEKNKELLDAQIKDIENHVSLESNIRAEAIKMIEDKNSGLYQKLSEWNKIYGTSLDADVRVAWNNAQTALGNYNVAQIGVQSVLEMLVTKMDAFERSTKNAAGAMQDLARESSNVKPPSNESGETADSIRQKIKYAAKQKNLSHDYREKQEIQDYIDELQRQLKEYHGGGIVTKGNQKTDESLGLKPDETLAKLKVGETVLSPDEPKTAMQLMADFLNSDAGSTFSGFRANPISQQLINDAVPSPIIPTDFSKYERANVTSTFDFTQGDIIIQGDASKQNVMDIKKITESVCSEIMTKVKRGGVGNMKVL